MRRRSKGKQHYDKDVIKRRLAARRMANADGGRTDVSLNVLLVLFFVLAVGVLGFILIWLMG